MISYLVGKIGVESK